MNKNELIKKLELFRLTNGESRVYLALLNGESIKSGIIRESGVSSSIVYEILEKLVKKGLVSYITNNGVKTFQAKNPDMLLSIEEEMLKKKKQIAKKIFPLLKQKKKENSKFVFASVYNGVDGFKNMLNDIEQEFNKGQIKDWLACGITAFKRDIFNRLWIKWHTNKRPKYGVKTKFIFSEKETDYTKKLSSVPLSESKYISLLTPTCITVTGDMVLIMKYTKEPRFFLIKDNDIAKTFRELFGVQWRRSRKLKTT